MISVGIDVSKGKSTICILKPFGEILMSPTLSNHTQSDLKELVSKLSKYEEELNITMEATGIYHLPIAQYGIDYWFRPCRESDIESIRSELKLLGNQYRNFMKACQERCLALCNILDRTNPGIYGIIDDFSRYTGKDNYVISLISFITVHALPSIQKINSSNATNPGQRKRDTVLVIPKPASFIKSLKKASQLSSPLKAQNWWFSRQQKY